MIFEAGTQLGSYEIIESVGQGGMATVYKAYHPPLDRQVAIKVIHSLFARDEAQRRRFRREARAVARLVHPNIVPVYDFAEKELQPYLVMRFIEGETLKDRMSVGPMAAAEITRIMSQIAAGLDYAHQQNVLHRDVKPSNIILGSNGEVFLTDFGLARLADAGESTISQDRMMGTPFYMSPEQARGDVQLTTQTDIYSFGIILYELVTGRVPFNADTSFTVVHNHIFAEPPRPSNLNPTIPTAVENVILRALRKQPEERYPTASVLMAEFARAVDDASGEFIVPALAQALQTTAIDATLDDEIPPLPILLEPPPIPLSAMSPVTPAPLPAPVKRGVWPWILLGAFLCATFTFFALILLSSLDDGSNTAAPAATVTAADAIVTTDGLEVRDDELTADDRASVAQANLLSINFQLLSERNRSIAAIRRDMRDNPESRFLQLELVKALVNRDEIDEAAVLLQESFAQLERPEAFINIADEFLVIKRPVEALLTFYIGYEKSRDDELQHRLVALMIMLDTEPVDIQPLLEFILAEETTQTNEIDLLLGNAHKQSFAGETEEAVAQVQNQTIISDDQFIGEKLIYQAVFLARGGELSRAQQIYDQAREAGYPDWMTLYIEAAINSN